MIDIKHGNILEEVKSGFIVHGCNTEGKMGSGIAAQIKNKYPAAFEAYYADIVNKRKLGVNPLGTITVVAIERGLYVVNAVTQTLTPNIKRRMNYEAMANCFEAVTKAAIAVSVTEISFPAIGAGLGGGKWPIIEAIIDNTLPDSLTKTLYLLP